MSERLPHPKKLSEQTAQQLQRGEIDLPDSELLRTASTYKKGEDYPNEELAKSKAERFAILAHLAREITKITLKGTGRETRFYQPIQTNPESLRYIRRNALISQLENDLFDDKDFEYAGTEVLRLPENAAIVARFNEIAAAIAESSDDDFYAKGDTIENRLGGITYDVIVGTCGLIKLVLNHIRNEHSSLSANEVRNVLLDNINVLEEIAALNLLHSQKRIHVVEDSEEGIEEYDTDILEYAQTKLLAENGKYTLIILNKNPKPKVGLFGATLGCPANYHLDEGDTVIRRMATAIINEAYDRKIFSNLKNQIIPPFDGMWI